MDSNCILLIIKGYIKKKKNVPVRYGIKYHENLKKLCKIYLMMKLNSAHSKRTIWVRDIFTEDQRYQKGASNNLVIQMMEKDPGKFINFFRMSPDMFFQLLHIIGPKIKRQNLIREAVSPEIRLQLTIRYLASGDSMASIGYLFRVAPNTVSKIIAETCQAIWDELKDEVFLKPSEENWKKIAREFEQKWNFKNCIGAIDGKHIEIQAPPNSGSTYYNYKGSHSYVLLAIADANYKFIMVDIGAEGRLSDSGIFKNSQMGQGFENTLLNVPPPDNNNLPYVLVGDEAFQLTSYMMRPFPRRGPLDIPKKVFNYRLSRARRVVENSFGLLAARWRIFRKRIIASESSVKKIIQASVCLHNYILAEDPSQCHEYFGTGHTSSNNREPCLVNIGRTGTITFSKNAATIREKFTTFFCTTGSVDWQWEKALNNDF